MAAKGAVQGPLREAVEEARRDKDSPDNLVYEKFRREAADGDLLLFRGASTLSRIIQYSTKSPYSHAGITVWWGERLMVLEAVGAGVRAVPTSLAIEAYQGHVEWFEVQGLGAQERRQVVDTAKRFLGVQYNFGGLGRFALRLLLGPYTPTRDGAGTPQALFCSEYVSRCYRLGGFDLLPEEADEMTSPGALARCPKLVWRGVIRSPSSHSG